MSKDLIKNVQSILFGAQPIDVAADMTASVKNSQEGPVITINSKNAAESFTIEVEDDKRSEILKDAIVFISDFNHAVKNGIKRFPMPKKYSHLCRYINTRDEFLTYIYKGEKKRLLQSHNDIYVKLETLESMTAAIIEEEKQKKKKNTAAGGSPNVMMTLDDMIAEISDTQSDRSAPVNEQSMSYER